VRLEPLYRLTFRYSAHWDAEVGGVLHRLLVGEGRCEGTIAGAFRGTNDSRRRPDGTFEPDYHGVIETDDGAAILFHLTGYGFPDERRVVATVKHATSDERYERLNRVVCAVNGELRDRSVVLDVAELVWEPLDTMRR
jgi:hypothetical protein